MTAAYGGAPESEAARTHNTRAKKSGDTLKDGDWNATVLMSLLKTGRCDVGLQNKTGATALWFAAGARVLRVESVAALLEHGADPNVYGSMDDAAPSSMVCESALSRATACGYHEVARLLKKHGARSNSKPSTPIAEPSVSPMSAPPLSIFSESNVGRFSKLEANRKPLVRQKSPATPSSRLPELCPRCEHHPQPAITGLATSMLGGLFRSFGGMTGPPIAAETRRNTRAKSVEGSLTIREKSGNRISGSRKHVMQTLSDPTMPVTSPVLTQSVHLVQHKSSRGWGDVVSCLVVGACLWAMVALSDHADLVEELG
eukprot:c18258_g2_i1.p1 GENE.c18258_g2_i1~~c18258_g2_i1.p1  ORF type:complete len:315 (-),score=49.91 c18258_g2_i1:101-1045(-)